MPDDPRQRRRTQDKGWQKWLGVIPIAGALGAAVVAGIIAFTTIELTVSAHGEDLKKIIKTQEEFRPRVRSLESKGAAVKERLDAIHLEQQRQGLRSMQDRREILDAIRALRQQPAR